MLAEPEEKPLKDGSHLQPENSERDRNSSSKQGHAVQNVTCALYTHTHTLETLQASSEDRLGKSV